MGEVIPFRPRKPKPIPRYFNEFEVVEIANTLLSYPKLGDSQRVLLTKLHLLAFIEGKCHFTTLELSKKLNRNIARVYDLCVALAQKGLIEVGKSESDEITVTVAQPFYAEQEGKRGGKQQ